jgi:hypothetical protein
VNFCYTPPAGELVLMGDGYLPASNYPLGECEADCDSDWDCEWGLTCLQRSGDEPVRGCTGTGLSTEDYCIKALPGELVVMGDENEPAQNFPLKECQGDCDYDSDCEVSSI